ncbi:MULTISPECIES: MFS transporter [unclassified Oceanispirochaeta]|uniref:MFS transporter n=1 Tax=unclassified Oceanispirochaeta TaxID=2635722 RepID=UPI000E09847D|nr:MULTISPECIES: MFS transporter [unclassified Oceanispirochaeta]MBF9019010.1 MFS transporter [Oceanispirochaeta sp. M2]NPD75508.1 MFS transporter [Oceanispirochaeta sp. M1]RDG28636.1 MFS transporter [Oceanispirochaeta sp. M1]
MKDKRNIMILSLGLLAFMTNGDNYAAAPLLLKISEDLGIGLQQAAYSVTAYMLSFGFFTLIFGPLSDRFGKVRIISIAAFGTAVFSILGGFAYNLPSLIVLRSFNGAFGAGVFPVTMALVGQSYNDKERQGALGKVMGLMFLGGASATALGGIISYFGSWRLVYIVYGIGELIVAFAILKLLQKDKGVVDKLNFIQAYKVPLSNYRFMRLVMVIFFVGFTVFGSFTYSGKLIQTLTGFSVLQVGLILSFFGLGTVLGGRIAPKAKMVLKHGFLVTAGVLGFAGLYILSTMSNVYLLIIGLFSFGVAFIFLQSTLVSAAQAKLPKMRGTAMSLASFNMFIGGAFGTAVNGRIMTSMGITAIFSYASLVIFTVGIVAAIFIARFEMRQSLVNN